MPSARPELRELAALLRHPEPGSSNIGEFVAVHADELAPLLQARPDALRVTAGRRDEDLVGPLRERLRAIGDLDRQRRADHLAKVAMRAATRLGATARWAEEGAVLDVDLFLTDVIADAARRYVVFTDAVELRVGVKRTLLVAVARLRRIHIDLVAFVNAAGLHFRWKGGRGGYNLRAQPVADDDALILVELRRRSDAIAQVGRPVHLGEALRELGLPG
jgi:hypothetical protein